MWQNLLISVCDSWQLSAMQNLRRVGKNAGPILSHLWTKVHVLLRRRRRPLLVASAVAQLCISRFFPRIQAVRFAVKLRNPRKIVVLEPPICKRRGNPRFRTCIYKSHSIPSMRTVLVEFRSANADSTWLTKIKNKSVVKYKSAQNKLIHQHDTRDKCDFHMSTPCTTFGKRSLKYKGSHMWNSLPESLKSIQYTSLSKYSLSVSC